MSAVSHVEQRLRAILSATTVRRHWSGAGAVTFLLALAILPCGLRYDFARPKAPAVSLDSCDPSAATAPVDHRENKLFVGCCPS
jgi:hypothetical protein